MNNWIADRNRFGLPKPPAFAMKALWDQDAALVLVPSNQTRKYLLGRRRSLSAPMAAILRKQKEDAEHNSLKMVGRVAESDSAMLERLGLVLVDSITQIRGNAAHGSWMRSLPTILAQLRARDTWDAGGAERLVAQIEEREQAERDKIRKGIEDQIEHRARDAWRSFQARTGQRNQRASSVPSVKFVPTRGNTASSSTAGFWGRD